MKGGAGLWADPQVGAPDYITFECNAGQARRLGFSTRYWRDFAWEHGCWLDFSLEAMSANGIYYRLPWWISGIFGVETTVLDRCGGSNHQLVCKPGHVMYLTYLFVFGAAVASLLGVAVVAETVSNFSGKRLKTKDACRAVHAGGGAQTARLSRTRLALLAFLFIIFFLV